jgi:hypothetical protein
MRKLSFAFFLFIAAFCSAQQKFALVIGNGNYTGLSKLSNPVNDTKDIAAALSDIGFDVDVVLDGSLDQMESAVLKLKTGFRYRQIPTAFCFTPATGTVQQCELFDPR